MALSLKSNTNVSETKRKKFIEIEQKVIQDKLKSQLAIQAHLDRERELSELRRNNLLEKERK